MDIQYINLTEGRVEEILFLWNKEIGDNFPMRKELLRQNTFEDVNVLLEGSWVEIGRAHV